MNQYSLLHDSSDHPRLGFQLDGIGELRIVRFLPFRSGAENHEQEGGRQYSAGFIFHTHSSLRFCANHSESQGFILLLFYLISYSLSTAISEGGIVFAFSLKILKLNFVLFQKTHCIFTKAGV